MKGIFHLRPSLPKYIFTWDIKILLDYYRSQSSNNDLDLKALTFKATTLLTLLLCQRAQAAYWLEQKHIKVEEDKIQIVFPSLVKQTRPVKHLKDSNIDILQNKLEDMPSEFIKIIYQ